MKLIDQITEAWAAAKAYRLALVNTNCDEYDRLDKLRNINLKELP